MDKILELQNTIHRMLVNNGLTALKWSKPDELYDPTYVVWYDRHCTPNEDPIIGVLLEETGIAAMVEARNYGDTVKIYDHDIDRSEWWEGIRANVLEVLERDGKHRCPYCGKPTKGNRKYCSATCRNLMVPELTAEQVMKRANRNILRLASLAAAGDKAYRKQLIEKYSIARR